MTGAALPPRMAELLGHPDLVPLWRAVAARLERNGLSPSGNVTTYLSDEAADRLGGLLGRTLRTGKAVQLKLAQVDEAFRRSVAAIGLVPAVEALTGAPLHDKRAVKQQQDNERAQVWVEIDSALAAAGLAAAPWVPRWQDSLRQGGILTRAGTVTATEQAMVAVAALGKLAGTTLPGLLPSDGASPALAGGSWELGQLAVAVSGDAHGLDDDRLAAALTVKALAASAGTPAPTSAAERRAVWSSAGVAPDSVSGTALVYGLRPTGDDPWSAMMRYRADLGLVTHLTVLELTALPEHVALTAAGRPVWACENPQVLQAAARSGSGATLVCLLGNPSSAGALLIRRLVRAGVAPEYHGDFDWSGVAIAGRLIAAGCVPWRMSAQDYRAAVSTDMARLPLSGDPVRTSWDPDLPRAMAAANVAVHEEALLPLLLADLGACSPPP